MTTWTTDELNKIGNAEEIKISSVRRDGTLRKPVTIWVVRVGDSLYIRSVYGRDSGWFRGTQVRHEGYIRAGGVNEDVTFVEETDLQIHEQIDAAYRAKYRRYPESIVGSTVTPQARAATIKLVPRPPSI